MAITKTCRQINAETSLLPVALNTFCGDVSHVDEWLIRRLNQRQIESVQSIFLTGYKSVLPGYGRFVGLKRVRVSSKLQSVIAKYRKFGLDLPDGFGGIDIEIATEKEVSEACLPCCKTRNNWLVSILLGR